MNDQPNAGPPDTPESGAPDHGEQPPLTPPPAYGQPSEYGPPPPGYGQQPPPAYIPPPAYVPPPEYAPPPSGYGSAPGYGSPQDVPPPYGEPQYPTQPYAGGDVPPQFPGAEAPPATGGPSGARRGVWISAGVAVLAALGVGGYFLFSGGSAGAATPTAAVRQLLDAAKTGDVPAAEKALCAADRNQEVLSDLRAAGRITSYSILSARQTDSGHAVVRARVTLALFPQPQTLSTRVIKEGGGWKACPSYSSSSGSGGGSLPSTGPTISGPSIGVPSGFPPITVPPVTIPTVPVPSAAAGFNPCGFIAGDATRAATTYVGLAELGETSSAQSCVYHGSVPRSVTASLHVTGPGSYFAPIGHSGSTFRFRTIDGSARLSVTVTKEPDGRFYVTKVVKH